MQSAAKLLDDTFFGCRNPVEKRHQGWHLEVGALAEIPKVGLQLQTAEAGSRAMAWAGPCEAGQSKQPVIFGVDR